MKTLRVSLILAAWLLLAIPSCWSMDVGDRVELIDRAIGIPGHPSAGERSVSLRFPSQSIVTIQSVDPATSWLNVIDQNQQSAWITQSYVDHVLINSAPPNDLCYTVGTWNLEHFHSGKKRGFPEYTKGGPSYDPRTPDEMAAIAAAIRDTLKAKILVLNEINGVEQATGEETRQVSPELDVLLTYLGPNYDYVLTASGGSQRVALLYDTRFVRLNAATEISVPRIEIQKSDVFARDPLVGYFSLLHDGQEQNDLVVVGLHLASGQHRTRNHDQAMKILLDEIEDLRQSGVVIPSQEFDLILGGDLNASRYDNKKEDFFDDLNTGSWAVLAGDTYPGTRVAGVPLEPRSQIDYLIVTRDGEHKGLLGEEISNPAATVHQELGAGEWNLYRQVYSDHFPVTTCVQVSADND